ncbi:MAG: hypothetical protein GY816_05460 [Cytophagales bacterium]|nr:hypothetical protein [Cytophagales bacterium]
MKRIFNYIISATLIFALASCNEDEVLSSWVEQNPEVDTTPTGEAGTLDLSNYVAIGNSLTAGYMDGALYDAGQSASYVNQLATQMQFAGAGAFNQPDINSIYGFNGTFSDLDKEIIAGRSYLDLSIPGPNAGANGELLTAYSGDKSALNNFGVPGMTLLQTNLSGFGFPDVGNPYFTRFAANPNTSSVLGDALATNPSFFSLWIGANDYLGYAISGGQGDTPLATLDADAFGAELCSILTQLTADGDEGVILDLPPVVTLPLFQAVPYNAIPMDQTSADALNSAYTTYNGGLAQALSGMLIDQAEHDRRTISFSASAGSAFVIEDDELTNLGGLPSYRLSEPTDLVLLSAVPAFSAGVGTSIPAGDQYILTVAEQTAIVTARATYNAVIEVTVSALNGAGADIALVTVQPTFVDALGLDAETATALALPTDDADGVSGIEINGITLSPDFTPNGIMSTDAVHPNARGSAIVTNLIIDVINERWDASIPNVDVLTQLGVPLSEN